MGADGGTREGAARRPREIAFDLLKGIGIAEVFCHHSLASSARKFTVSGSVEWWALMLLNRILHFAIPTFLLVSAILLARSLAKHERLDLKRYASRRMARTVWPYLVWSGIYLLFRAFVVRSGYDPEPYTAQLFGFKITAPKVLLSPESLTRDLLWGKAYFHLYFLVVLTQVSILVPALVLLLRARRIGFGTVVAIAASAQLGVVVLQRYWLQVPYPAAMATWYLPSILIGVWLGVNWKQWQSVWSKNDRWIVGVAIMATVPYIWFACWSLQGRPFFAPLYSINASIYSTAVALSLLGLTTGIRGEGKLVSGLVAAGVLSLPLFVIHPMLMYLMGGPRVSGIVTTLYGSPMWALLILAASTWVFTKALIFLRLDRLLFARNFARETAFVRDGLRPAATASAVVAVDEA